MSEQTPRVPTFEEMRDRAWNNMLDWLEGRQSWTNLGPHPPYTPDVVIVMDRQEVEKWLSVHESMARLADQFPDLEGAEEELAALEAKPGGGGRDRMRFTTDFGKMRIATTWRRTLDMQYLYPQEVFDALPIETRDRIDLDDFKAVLTTNHLMFVELQHRQVDKHAMAHELEITSVERMADDDQA